MKLIRDWSLIPLGISVVLFGILDSLLRKIMVKNYLKHRYRLMPEKESAIRSLAFKGKLAAEERG